MKEDNYYEPRFVDISSLENIDIIGTEFINKAINKLYELIQNSTMKG